MSRSKKRFPRVLLERTEVGRAAVVTLAGELDLSSATVLHRALARTAGPATPNVTVDLRHVRFMDCSALHPLVAAYAEARRWGGCLRVVAVKGEPLMLLRATSLTGLFCVHRSLRSATASHCARHGAAPGS
jgi:anti-sigma B factor antagonist